MRVMRHVQHAEILYIGTVADPNVIHIPSNDGMKPRAAVFAHDDIPDHDGRVLDEARSGDSGCDALEGADHERLGRMEKGKSKKAKVSSLYEN